MWREYPPNTSWQHPQEQQYSGVVQQSVLPQPWFFWRPPVADDRTNFGAAVVGFFLIAIIWISQGIAFFGDSHLSLLPRFGALLVFYLFPSLMLLLGIWTHKQAKRWRVVNQRRHLAAVWGITPAVPLAEPQPVPNFGALPPYFTIKLKMNWLAACA